MHNCDIKMLQVRERRTILRTEPSRKIWEFGRFFETVRGRREVGRGQRLFLWKVQWKGNFDIACFTGKNELQVWRKNVGFFDSEIILISELFLIFKYIYMFAKLLSGRQREHFSVLESEAVTCLLVYGTVPLMLNVKQWSCEYQILTCFCPDLESYPSLPIQKYVFVSLENPIDPFVYRTQLYTIFFQRTATKRTCIKTLPPILTIQLKRFGYDWEAGRSLKFDHYFKFPHEVDMQPYLHDSTSSIAG